MNLEFRMRDGRVPTALRFEGKTVRATNFRDSSHVLVATTLSPGVEGEVSYNLHNVAVSARLLQGVDKTYVYMRVDQYIMTRSKALLALVTRHFNGLFNSIYWDDPTHVGALFRDRHPEREENAPMSTDEAESLPTTKITAQHHIHFTPREIDAATSRSSEERKRTSLRLPRDATLSMAAGVMLWYRSLDDYLAEMVRNTGLFKVTSIKEFKLLAKEISTEAKSLQNLVSEDLRSVFEIDVLVNRMDGMVDWEAEKENRVNPRLAQLSYQDVFTSAEAIFVQAASIGREPTSMKWDKFWASRWQWSAAGSIHSQYQDDENYIIRTSRELKNKFITIANMPKVLPEYFTSRPPAVHGWASTKYEWGKQRAIYGTDLTSYVIANFAFYNCENVLPNRFPVGKDANDTNVVNRVAGVLKNRLPYCLDFEDFNSQHSVDAMQAVIDAYGHVFRNTFTGEQMEALKWTSDSIRTQIIHDNVGLKEEYRAKGTLLSGWRLTTFVNSVLNAVYTDKLCGDAMMRNSSLHNGDDVLIGTFNLEIARRSLSEGKKMGIRIQPAKCAFGGIAEFLRIDHVRGSKGQYLTRAVATLMHSRIESSASTDARDLVQSMENRFSDCKSRGMSNDTIALLRRLYYGHQSKVCGNTVEEMYLIKTSHRVAGGISEQVDSRTDVFVKPGVMRKGDIEVPKLSGVGAYAREVAVALQMEDRTEEMVKRVYKATYEAVVPKNRRMGVFANRNKPWCDNVKAIYKAFRGSIDTAGYGKAALVGFAIDVLLRDRPDSTLVMALKRSPDPTRLIKYLV
nr:putative RNA-dependent RNA polymerase [Poaceae Liege totivirus 16]